MKRTISLFVCVAVCCAMMVSCKNSKTAEPTPEEIQAQKVALADSILAQIDAFAEQYYDASTKSFNIETFELTEDEKLVKPDYLLDPSVARTLISKSQKVNALAIYAMENGVREIYGMPCDEANESIATLAAEINHPIDVEFMTGDIPTSEKIKREYEICKERGDLAYFWQFQNAIMVEIGYILACNPEIFFRKITEEQWQGFISRSKFKNEALSKLSQYDEDIAAIMDIRAKTLAASSFDKFKESNSTVELAKQFRIANKDKYVARRNALLQ